VNFNKYKVQRMADIPPIEIKIIPSEAPPSGMGEAGVTIAASAIADGVAKLTGGKRLRQLPMSPDRVKAVISA
jgi:isoquinoline 1-oxidoreductase subunit beta